MSISIYKCTYEYTYRIFVYSAGGGQLRSHLDCDRHVVRRRDRVCVVCHPIQNIAIQVTHRYRY